MAAAPSIMVGSHVLPGFYTRVLSVRCSSIRFHQYSRLTMDTSCHLSVSSLCRHHSHSTMYPVNSTIKRYPSLNHHCDKWCSTLAANVTHDLWTNNNIYRSSFFKETPDIFMKKKCSKWVMCFIYQIHSFCLDPHHFVSICLNQIMSGCFKEIENFVRVR
jgi:hypothetical protein